MQIAVVSVKEDAEAKPHVSLQVAHRLWDHLHYTGEMYVVPGRGGAPGRIILNSEIRLTQKKLLRALPQNLRERVEFISFPGVETPGFNPGAETPLS